MPSSVPKSVHGFLACHPWAPLSAAGSWVNSQGWFPSSILEDSLCQSNERTVTWQGKSVVESKVEELGVEKRVRNKRFPFPLSLQDRETGEGTLEEIFTFEKFERLS